MFYSWCFFFVYFFSPHVLRAPAADRLETLPHDVNLGALYNAGPFFFGGGALPKKIWGPKTCKISVDFIQPPNLIANISGKAQDIQNRKANVSRSILPAFYEEAAVNFGPLISEI